MPKKKQRARYDPQDLLDAEEHHALSRGLGILTWGTWDHDKRPVEQRIADFIAAFPPDDPTRHLNPGLEHRPDRTYAPATRAALEARFEACDWRPGSLDELLARYGLKRRNGPPMIERPFVPDALRATAQRRNHKLRVLHGGVDIEPADMDAAKVAFLETQEKVRAAEEIRAARRRMRAENERPPGNDDQNT